MLRSAEAVHLVREKAHHFGVRGFDPDEVRFDLSAAVERKDQIVEGIINGIHKGLEGNRNISLIRGHAAFTSPHEIIVDGKIISGDKIFLAVGSRQADPHIQGLRETGFITNHEALQLRELPKSMIVIGAGYIGVEFSQMYSRFGTQVTLLGRASNIMPKEEPELSSILMEILMSEGVNLKTSTEVIRAGKQSGRKFVIASHAGRELRFEADEILLAAGRTARLDGLGLEEAGVDTQDGFIAVDDHLRTAAPHIWSLGDANGGFMFTHRATYDGPIAALNAIKDAGRKTDYRIVPRAIFSEPALASVGLSEDQAIRKGYKVKTGSAHFKDSGRAKALAQTEGKVKIVVNAETNEILGGHILGPRADDLIHAVGIAMQSDGNLERLTKSIYIHPTLSEVIKNAAKAAR